MSLLQIHDIAILSAHAPLIAGNTPSDLELGELLHNQIAEIIEAHSRLGRKISSERIERRFKHGLRFFLLWKGDALVGSTWAVSDSDRYIDEFAWSLPLRPDEIWLRDVFIAPKARGNKLFTHMTKLMTYTVNPGCTKIWSDVDWKNKPSMRAHLGAGFQIWKRSRAIVFADRLLLRAHIGNWHLPIAHLAPDLRALWWSDDLRTQHESLIA